MDKGNSGAAGDTPVAIVTGANAGIGRATATELVTRGYTVVLACRSEEAAKEAAKGMQSQAGSAQVIATVDLASPDSIKSFADTFKGKFSRLDLLVNNAGCNFVPDWYTPSGVLGIVQVNYLGPFHLTRLLESQLIRCNARVVSVSSSMHRFTRIKDVTAFLTSTTEGKYGTSKFANALFSQQLLKRSQGRIRASSVDPGGVDTGIFRHHGIMAPAARLLGSLGMFASPEEGCQAVVHACTAPWPYENGTSEHGLELNAPFYARGLFAHSALVRDGHNGAVDKAVRNFFIGVCGLFDQPLRTVFGARFGTGTTYAVAPNEHVLDSKIGDALWSVSSQLCQLPDDIVSA